MFFFLYFLFFILLFLFNNKDTGKFTNIIKNVNKKRRFLEWLFTLNLLKSFIHSFFVKKENAIIQYIPFLL